MPTTEPRPPTGPNFTDVPSGGTATADAAAPTGKGFGPVFTGGEGVGSDFDRLRVLVADLAVVHGRVTLASGREADYYVDLRRITLHATAAPLVGRVMLRLVSDWDFAAVGGLTMGADPVATAILHAAAADPAATGGRVPDAFVVRKEGKAHGLQRRIEGPQVEGRRVLVVEDTSTTGGSALTAVEALREAGADVVGVAVIVDRDTGARQAVEAAGLPYRYAFDLHDLGLPRA